MFSFHSQPPSAACDVPGLINFKLRRVYLTSRSSFRAPSSFLRPIKTARVDSGNIQVPILDGPALRTIDLDLTAAGASTSKLCEYFDPVSRQHATCLITAWCLFWHCVSEKFSQLHWPRNLTRRELLRIVVDVLVKSL